MNVLTEAQRAEDERIRALSIEHEAQREASRSPHERATELAGLRGQKHAAQLTDELCSSNYRSATERVERETTSQTLGEVARAARGWAEARSTLTVAITKLAAAELTYEQRA